MNLLLHKLNSPCRLYSFAENTFFDNMICHNIRFLYDIIKDAIPSLIFINSWWIFSYTDNISPSSMYSEREKFLTLSCCWLLKLLTVSDSCVCVYSILKIGSWIIDGNSKSAIFELETTSISLILSMMTILSTE